MSELGLEPAQPIGDVPLAPWLGRPGVRALWTGTAGLGRRQRLPLSCRLQKRPRFGQRRSCLLPTRPLLGQRRLGLLPARPLLGQRRACLLPARPLLDQAAVERGAASSGGLERAFESPDPLLVGHDLHVGHGDLGHELRRRREPLLDRGPKPRQPRLDLPQARLLLLDGPARPPQGPHQRIDLDPTLLLRRGEPGREPLDRNRSKPRPGRRLAVHDDGRPVGGARFDERGRPGWADRTHRPPDDRRRLEQLGGRELPAHQGEEPVGVGPGPGRSGRAQGEQRPRAGDAPQLLEERGVRSALRSEIEHDRHVEARVRELEPPRRHRDEFDTGARSQARRGSHAHHPARPGRPPGRQRLGPPGADLEHPLAGHAAFDDPMGKPRRGVAPPVGPAVCCSDHQARFFHPGRPKESRTLMPCGSSAGGSADQAEALDVAGGEP